MDQLQKVQDAFRNLRVGSSFSYQWIELMNVGEQDIFQSEISTGIRMLPRYLDELERSYFRAFLFAHL
jgi:hypothetical protein